jgi:WD40 repeat protein
MLISSFNSKIHLWDWKKSVIVREYSGHLNSKSKIDSFLFEYKGRQLVLAGSENGKLFIWNAQT